MVTVIIGLFSVYLLFMVLLLWGWNKAFRPHRTLSGSSAGVQLTVVIAARNEEHGLGDLLSDLAGQDDLVSEVIVVDDHSCDGTARIVEQRIQEGQGNLKLIKLSQDAGKKQALSSGIANADGNIIITTDADCRVSREWLLAVRKEFADTTLEFLFGGVRIEQDGSLWSAIEGIEFASLIGSGAALYGLGIPVLCNGANLAFRKNTFNEVGGFAGNQQIASGDDIFLLQKIFRRNKASVRFCTDRGHVVSTRGTTSAEQFIAQRIRWAGKWKSQGKAAGITAFFIFLFHTLFIAINGVAIAFGFWREVLGLWILKASIEYLFLRHVAAFTGLRWNDLAFLILQMFYSFYVVIFGLLAQAGIPEWKGRKIKSLRLVSRD